MKDIIVLCGGGRSSEREVSIRSGNMVYSELVKNFRAELVTLDEDALPENVASRQDAIIFPVTHGEFVEDGGLQRLMEDAGLCYIGSNSVVSALCMDKFATKGIVSKVGVPVVSGLKFSVKSGVASLKSADILPGDYVLKPNDKGSSVYVQKVNEKTFDDAVKSLYDGEFLLEKNIIGQDLTVGILDGKALEIVEILPKNGFLDYDNKYTPGASDRICPANIDPEVTNLIKQYAEAAYKACNCRDWARIDFMLNGDEVFFLEINTIPGMTATSFYPLSARAAGLSYEDMLAKLVNLAAARFDLN